MKKITKADIFIFISFVGLNIAFFVFSDTFEFHRKNDGQKYILVTQAFIGREQLPMLPPFTSRVLQPLLTAWIVRITHSEVETTFTWVSLLFNIISIVAMILVLKHYHVSYYGMVSSIAMYFTIFWTARFQACYIDNGMMAFVWILTYLSLKEHYKTFLFILAVAMFHKESIAVMAIFCLVIAYRKTTLKHTLILVVAIAVILMLFAIVRYRIMPFNNMEGIYLNRMYLRWHNLWRLPMALISGTGMMTVLLMCPTASSFLKKNYEWFAFIGFFFLVFFGYDKARLFQQSLPVLVVLGAIIIPTISSWLFALMFTFHLYIGQWIPVNDYDKIIHTSPAHIQSYDGIYVALIYNILILVLMLCIKYLQIRNGSKNLVRKGHIM